MEVERPEELFLSLSCLFWLLLCLLLLCICAAPLAGDCFCPRITHRECLSRWRSCGGVAVHSRVSVFVLVELLSVPFECGAAPEEDLGDAEASTQTNA